MVVATGTMAEGGESGSAATPLTFQNFLEKMRHPSASELVKSVKSFISSFGSGGVVDAEADSARIQEFLTTTEGAFRGHPAWRGASDDELDASGEGLEKYLMTKLHPSTFAVTGDDKRADKHLARRAAALRTFIRPEHLDIPAHFRVETSWRLAEEELAKVNHFKAPRDKLVCVLNTCRIVNNLLNTAGGNKPAGADDFLPVLIYVVLRANPPFLESNLRYIARFRRESRLRSEAAYFYTNLVSAAHFLASCDHAAFTNLDADVFEAHMLAEGVDPKQKPEDVELGEEAAAAPERDALRASRTTQAASTSSEAVSEPLRRENARLRAELEAAKRSLEEKTALVARVRDKWRSVDDVEVEGAASLAAQDERGGVPLPYKFAYARADDLQIGDVPELLAGYKSLALQYEALTRGAAAMLEDLEGGDGGARRSGHLQGASKDEKGAGGRREAEVADVDGLATFAPGPSAAASPANAAGAEDPFAGLVIGRASDATSTRDATFAGL